jgi:hypothetical protein
VIDEVQPESCMEWLWTFDLVELSWDLALSLRLNGIAQLTGRISPRSQLLLNTHEETDFGSAS